MEGPGFDDPDVCDSATTVVPFGIHPVTNICDPPTNWGVTDICDVVNIRRMRHFKRAYH